MSYTGLIPIIILNWNNASDTIDCIESVCQQSEQSFHLYVVDNASNESDRNLLVNYLQGKTKLTFIQNDSNLGFGLAHNEIFEKYIFSKDYKYVILLNNDTTVEKDWLKYLIICAGEMQAQMVSCKMVQFEKRDRINNLGHKFQNTGDILPIGNNEPENKFNKRFFNAGPSGGAALYDVNMLKHIGVFDTYFFCGYEDAELGLRGVLAGYKAVVEPNSIVFHKVSASVDKVRNYDFTLKIQLDILYSYYTLMPLPVILCNLPFIIFRNTLLLLVFCCFFRFKYVRIFFHGRYLFITRDIKRVLMVRKERATLRKLGILKILKLQEFFLFDNIQRFYSYFIKGNKTIFEKF